MKRWTAWIVLGVAAAALLAGAATLWYTSPRQRTILTDGESIRLPAEGAAARDVLWQPAIALPGIVNTTEPEYEPGFSEDGNILYFVRGKAGGNADLYVSTRTHSGWTEPEPLAAVNSGADDLGPCPTLDGRDLYFYSNRPGGQGGYDLWVSHRGEGGWLPPVNLGPSVNSTLNDYGPAAAPDGKTIYFASNRPREADAPYNAEAWQATIREKPYSHHYDLYAATIGADGAGRTQPLDALNTAGDEGTPAISPFGDFVYFSSDRAGGLGGLDLYRARRIDGQPGEPENLGPAINSDGNDLDPALTLGGFGLYFSSDRVIADAPASEVRDYNLFRSFSREVFEDTTTTRRSVDLALLLPWLWMLLLLGALALLLWLLARARHSQGFRRLSLLAKCLLISLLIHALVLLGSAFWLVGSSIQGLLQRSSGTRIALTSGRGADALTTQVRGGLTEVSVEPAGVPATAARLREEAPALPSALIASPGLTLTALQSRATAPEEAPSPSEHPTRTPDAPTIALRETQTPDAPSPEQAHEGSTQVREVARPHEIAAPPLVASQTRPAEARITLGATAAPPPESTVAAEGAPDAPVVESEPTTATVSHDPESASVGVGTPAVAEGVKTSESALSVRASAPSTIPPAVRTETRGPASVTVSPGAAAPVVGTLPQAAPIEATLSMRMELSSSGPAAPGAAVGVATPAAAPGRAVPEYAPSVRATGAAPLTPETPRAEGPASAAIAPASASPKAAALAHPRASDAAATTSSKSTVTALPAAPAQTTLRTPETAALAPTSEPSSQIASEATSASGRMSALPIAGNAATLSDGFAVTPSGPAAVQARPMATAAATDSSAPTSTGPTAPPAAPAEQGVAAAHDFQAPRGVSPTAAAETPMSVAAAAGSTVAIRPAAPGSLGAPPPALAASQGRTTAESAPIEPAPARDSTHVTPDTPGAPSFATGPSDSVPPMQMATPRANGPGKGGEPETALQVSPAPAAGTLAVRVATPRSPPIEGPALASAPTPSVSTPTSESLAQRGAADATTSSVPAAGEPVRGVPLAAMGTVTTPPAADQRAIPSAADEGSPVVPVAPAPAAAAARDRPMPPGHSGGSASSFSVAPGHAVAVDARASLATPAASDAPAQRRDPATAPLAAPDVPRLPALAALTPGNPARATPLGSPRAASADVGIAAAAPAAGRLTPGLAESPSSPTEAAHVAPPPLAARTPGLLTPGERTSAAEAASVAAPTQALRVEVPAASTPLFALPLPGPNRRGMQDALGTLSGLVLDAITGEPLNGATVRLDLPEGDALLARTGPDGMYVLQPPALPDHVAVSASHEGYTPDSASIPAIEVLAGLRQDFHLAPVERSVVALEGDPEVHHLGNDEFEGRINSQFQRPSEGLIFEAGFVLSPEQLPPHVGRAEVILLVRGAQAPNEIRVNGWLLDRRLDTAPADGSFGEFRTPIPVSALLEGENVLTIRSRRGNSDLDDFEFVNVRVRLVRAERRVE